jgi:hypothetical protein
MDRLTVVVDGPLAFQMRRWEAVTRRESGVQICTLPMLAARLAGGFYRAAGPLELQPAIARALAQGGFLDLDSMRELPGMIRAVARTLADLWASDVNLADLANANSRLIDVGVIEQRTREALPVAVLAPPVLRDRALARAAHAAATLGAIVLDRISDVPRIWRPLLTALQEKVSVRWIDPSAADRNWFSGEVEAIEAASEPLLEVVSCADPHAEAIESLRWARELIASGKARPEQIAICASSTQPWDEHFLTLATSSDVPLHFSSGRPALSTRAGQACGALADLLQNGLSQDRVRRLLSYYRGEVPPQWAKGIPTSATLREVNQWQHALDQALPREPQRVDPAPVLLPILDLLSEGITVVAQAGERLLEPVAQSLWTSALSLAPAQALEFSLQTLRVTDPLDPCASVVWGPARHFVGAPRAYVRLIGLNSGSWPRRTTEDPLLPEHLRSWPSIEAESITQEDRSAFHRITARAQDCTISFSRRDGAGRPLSASPLVSAHAAKLLTRGRIPAHAFNEADRLMARPKEAVQSPRVARSLECWRAWQSGTVTAHDGVVRADHPLIARATARVQSATSLRLMLRDPLTFVWRYALDWYTPVEEEEPLTLTDRAAGELVHELLRRSVSALEPAPGYSNATEAQIDAALEEAVRQVREQWPLLRSVPPKLLWEHTLRGSRQLAKEALTFEARSPNTRYWTEVPFGQEKEQPGEWPWDPRTTVSVPGANVAIRGSIDRVDCSGEGPRVQVTDYKTGAAPGRANKLVLGGGAELQRVIYAVAIRALLPAAPQVVARLVYLGGEEARTFELDDLEGAIQTVAKAIVEACRVLHQGQGVPHTRRRQDEPEDDFRLALPADLETYIERKRPALRDALGEALQRFWRHW